MSDENIKTCPYCGAKWEKSPCPQCGTTLEVANPAALPAALQEQLNYIVIHVDVALEQLDQLRTRLEQLQAHPRPWEVLGRVLVHFVRYLLHRQTLKRQSKEPPQDPKVTEQVKQALEEASKRQLRQVEASQDSGLALLLKILRSMTISPRPKPIWRFPPQNYDFEVNRHYTKKTTSAGSATQINLDARAEAPSKMFKHGDKVLEFRGPEHRKETHRRVAF